MFDYTNIIIIAIIMTDYRGNVIYNNTIVKDDLRSCSKYVTNCIFFW